MKDDPRLIDKRLNYNSHNAIKKDILQVHRQVPGYDGEQETKI